MIEVTNVKIHRIFNDPDKMFVGVASVVLNDAIAINDIRILKSPDKMFVAMPNRKLGESTYKDMVHPVDHETRKIIEEAILSAYIQAVREQEESEEA